MIRTQSLKGILKCFSLLGLLLFWSSFAHAQHFTLSDDFITQWQPNASNEITIPIRGTASINVYWEEIGNTTNKGTATADGTNDLTISGLPSSPVKVYVNPTNLTQIQFIDPVNMPNSIAAATEILDVIQWGNAGWTSFKGAFANCSNLKISATDNPDLSGVTDMSYAFYKCSTLNTSNLKNWDVSAVTDMPNMLDNSGIDCANFSDILVAWNTLTVQSTVTLGASGLLYSTDAASAYNDLTSTDSWTINGTTASDGVTPAISITSTPSTPEICKNESITMDATSGNGTISWDNGYSNNTSIQPTSTTTYTATATTGSTTPCLTNESIKVVVNTLPVVDLGTDTSICAGTTLKDTLVAPVGMTSYLWNDGSTNDTLAIQTNKADTFFVAVTNANGCVGHDSVFVTENPLPIVDLGADTSFCSGTTLKDTLVAPAGFTSYLWSDGSTNDSLAVQVTQEKEISIEVTGANGCVGKDTITYSYSAEPVFTLGHPAICSGGSDTINPGLSNADYSFLWSDNSTDSVLVVSDTGTYSVKVTLDSTGCFVNKTVYVDQSPGPIASFNVYVVDDTMIYIKNSSEGATSYHWDFGNGDVSNISDGFFHYSYNDNAGEYTVTLTVTNACGTDVSTKVVKIGMASTKELNAKLGIKVSPNPFSHNIQLDIDLKKASNASIVVYSTSGKVVYSIEKMLDEGENTIHLQKAFVHQPNGLYFIRVGLENGARSLQKVVKIK